MNPEHYFLLGYAAGMTVGIAWVLLQLFWGRSRNKRAE